MYTSFGWWWAMNCSLVECLVEWTSSRQSCEVSVDTCNNIHNRRNIKLRVCTMLYGSWQLSATEYYCQVTTWHKHAIQLGPTVMQKHDGSCFVTHDKTLRTYLIDRLCICKLTIGQCLRGWSCGYNICSYVTSTYRLRKYNSFCCSTEKNTW